MDGDNTPGQGGQDYCCPICNNEYCDLNGACVPTSKEDGGNLKKIQDNIRSRFNLEEEGIDPNY